MKQKGTTLVEQLVTCALLTVFLLMVYYTFSTLVKHVKRLEAQTDLQRETLQAIAWFNREAGDATAGGFWDYTNTPDEGIIFISPRDANQQVSFDAVGRLLWSSYVGYYREDRGAPPRGFLIRRQCPIAPDWNLPAPIDIPTLKSMPGTERVIGHDVVRIEGDPDNEGGDPLDLKPLDLHQPQQLTLFTRLTDDSSRSYGLKISTSIFFRN